MMEPIWTNLDIDELHSINGPVDQSGLTEAQELGITAGRKAADKAELVAGLRANGLAPGSPEYDEALKAGLDAMRLTQEREAATMCVLSPDGQWVPDEDYRAAARMKVEQL